MARTLVVALLLAGLLSGCGGADPATLRACAAFRQMSAEYQAHAIGEKGLELNSGLVVSVASHSQNADVVKAAAALHRAFTHLPGPAQRAAQASAMGRFASVCQGAGQ